MQNEEHDFEYSISIKKQDAILVIITHLHYNLLEK